MQWNTDVLVVGAGLAGLSLARRLDAAGVDYLLVEARSRVGGRVLSVPARGTDARDDRFDLGPAWFWPGQPRIAELVGTFALGVFEQHAAGRLVFEDRQGAVRRDLDFSTMGGALRIAGGVSRLVEAILASLPPDRVRLSTAVVTLDWRQPSIQAEALAPRGPVRIAAHRVALAIPPRLVASSVGFRPDLPHGALDAMSAIPTWMAGHAKVVAVYDRPFWREADLSGDAISHRGPLAEIHDASPASARCGALFGFAGYPAAQRRALGDGWTEAAVRQLAHLFGAPAGHPIDLLVRDWAQARFTSTATDEPASTGHPEYGLPPSLRGLCGGRLVLASTESSAGFGGLLEGALEAAAGAFAALCEPPVPASASGTSAPSSS